MGYQIMPELTPDEYEALRTDIEAHGVQIPVEVDEDGNILDGYHRAKICEELGIDYPRKIRAGLTEEEKIDFAIRINLNRRHLTREQRQELVAKLRQKGWSYRRIGEALGVNRMTAIRDTEAGGTFVPPDQPVKVVGKDGKTYPAVRPKVAIEAASAGQLEKAREIVLAAQSGDERARRALEALDKGQTTIHAAHKRLAAMDPIKPPPLPEGKFDLIYADPPWRYDFAESSVRTIENQYPTMTVDEICALDIVSITANDAVLFLWATNPKLEDALKVIRAWGFTYRTNMVWVKDKIGMGYYARQRHELILIAKRGDYPAPQESVRPESVVFAPRTAHSEKPEIVYELLERMYPAAKKIELFARRKRPGWHTWGTEDDDIYVP